MNITLIRKVFQAILNMRDCVRKLSEFLALLAKRNQHRKKSSNCEICLNSETLCGAELFNILLDVNCLYDVPLSRRALLSLHWYTCSNPPTQNSSPEYSTEVVASDSFGHNVWSKLSIALVHIVIRGITSFSSISGILP